MNHVHFLELERAAAALAIRRAAGPDLSALILDERAGRLAGRALAELLSAAGLSTSAGHSDGVEVLVASDPLLGVRVSQALAEGVRGEDASATDQRVAETPAHDEREGDALAAPASAAPAIPVLTESSDPELVAGKRAALVVPVAGHEAFASLRGWVEGSGGDVVLLLALADDGALGSGYVDRSGVMPRAAAIATRELALLEEPRLEPAGAGTQLATPGASPYAERPTDGGGPWADAHPGEPAPADPRLDARLLGNGDHRNVVDRYRYWSVDAIRADLATHRAPLHVAIENLAHDLNIGSIVRTANAYNAGGVHIVGRHKWNRRGALVTDRYLDMLHHDGPAGLRAWADEHGYKLVAIDNQPGATAIEHTALPERAVLVFGQEQSGISAELLAVCDSAVEITQHGSTRSLNVAAAAAIAMYEWARQHL